MQLPVIDEATADGLCIVLLMNLSLKHLLQLLCVCVHICVCDYATATVCVCALLALVHTFPPPFSALNIFIFP